MARHSSVSREGTLLDFVRENISNWTEGNLWYDERVPHWALLPVLISAATGSVALLFALSTRDLGEMPSASMMPLVVASVGLATGIVAKWVIVNKSRSVAIATVSSLWTSVTWLGVAPQPTEGPWAPFALLFLAPVVATMLGRGWAMLAWHCRLEATLRASRAAMMPLLAGRSREGVLLLHVDAVRGDEVELTVFDGRETFSGRARKHLWASVGPGRWYLARGATLADAGASGKARTPPSARSLPRLESTSSLEFVGVVDPRSDRARESFVPELVFWVFAVAGVMVMSAAGAWALVFYGT